MHLSTYQKATYLTVYLSIHVASRRQPPAPNLAQQAFAFECSGLGHAVEVGVLAHDVSAALDISYLFVHAGLHAYIYALYIFACKDAHAIHVHKDKDT